MKKYLLVALSTLCLSACGGSSDSSGSSNNNASETSYEIRFNSLPTCVVSETDKIIYAARSYKATNPSVPTIPGLESRFPEECKIKLPNVNGGLTFSLHCTSFGGTSIAVRGESSHMDELKQMLATGKPYQVTCEK